ncbi:hypothetical protein [Pseudovibrio sp. POLY-S9]|uniref:hypothetical protein n=1 Tax=Pseudovibrio sp. POLY-S9 TaxID=1576596 RepID=UPI00070ADB91|nr:hypothetical protein [Pseudovibrio sp. POLY-S9]
MYSINWRTIFRRKRLFFRVAKITTDPTGLSALLAAADLSVYAYHVLKEFGQTGRWNTDQPVGLFSCLEGPLKAWLTEEQYEVLEDMVTTVL